MLLISFLISFLSAKLDHGDRPVMSSKASTPTDHQSLWRPAGLPARVSGDMYARLPTGERGSSAIRHARPMSMSLTWPLASTMMFSTLMSRWMKPCACMCSSATTTSDKRTRASSSTKPQFFDMIRLMRWKKRSPPATRSRAKKTCVLLSKAMWHRWTKGDGGSWVMTLSSVPRRLRSRGRVSLALETTLSAYSSPVWVCSALTTTAYPPRPRPPVTRRGACPSVMTVSQRCPFKADCTSELLFRVRWGRASSDSEEN
mmetsp:Transcript_25859/g.57954  ORF Transcript_25859/g.57954 Transcript_25859/m.57954 type:complete len:258 (+) Transcript_25859:711-1484(+)